MMQVLTRSFECALHWVRDQDAMMAEFDEC